MKYLFWSEFPDKTNFKKLNLFFKKNDFKTRVGIAVKNKKEYEKYKKEFQKYKNIKLERAWPILPKKEGYWFSSHTSKKSINTLNQWKGEKIKIDIETPFPGKGFSIKNLLKPIKQFLTTGKNKKQLKNTIKKLSKTSNIMLSTFPLPRFILKKQGFIFDKKISYNYIMYSSFLPKLIRPLYRWFYKFFIRKRLKEDKNTHFALGLITPGIFGNEPSYENVNELEKDLKFLQKQGVKNVVIFRLGSLQEIKNPKEWIKILKKY